jgi:hypothetical protein
MSLTSESRIGLGASGPAADALVGYDGESLQVA